MTTILRFSKARQNGPFCWMRLFGRFSNTVLTLSSRLEFLAVLLFITLVKVSKTAWSSLFLLGWAFSSQIGSILERTKMNGHRHEKWRALKSIMRWLEGMPNSTNFTASKSHISACFRPPRFMISVVYIFCLDSVAERTKRRPMNTNCKLTRKIRWEVICSEFETQ